MHEIRMDRRDIPTLPRPAYEVGAEATDDGEIRVWIQGDQSVVSAVTELPAGTQLDVQSRVEFWMKGRREFARQSKAWDEAAEIASRRIAEWSQSRLADDLASEGRRGL